MASEKLKTIFLSASIPLVERDPKYIDSADVIAIRDSVIALCSIVLPKFKLVWGGHPSITPLVNYVLQKSGKNIQDHVHLFQSRFFEQYFPDDNNQFENITLIDSAQNRDDSLLLMRKIMLSSEKFSAAIFIGGMEGINQEYELFRQYNTESLILPLASTGAAAKILYESLGVKEERLESDYAYMSVFQDLLIDKL